MRILALWLKSLKIFTHPTPVSFITHPSRSAWWCNFRELPVRYAVGEAVAPDRGGSGDPIFDFCQPSAKADAAQLASCIGGSGAQCVAEGLDRKCLVDELRGRVGLIAFEVLLPSGVDCRQDRAARIDFPYLGGGLAWVRSTQPYQGFANAERPV